MIKKYKVVTSERYFAYKTMVIEAEDEDSAIQVANDAMDDCIVELTDLEWDGSEVIDVEEVIDE
jgi:hypothetical protein